jgi:hypothetical protein
MGAFKHFYDGSYVCIFAVNNAIGFFSQKKQQFYRVVGYRCSYNNKIIKCNTKPANLHYLHWFIWQHKHARLVLLEYFLFSPPGGLTRKKNKKLGFQGHPLRSNKSGLSSTGKLWIESWSPTPHKHARLVLVALDIVLASILITWECVALQEPRWAHRTLGAVGLLTHAPI